MAERRKIITSARAFAEAGLIPKHSLAAAERVAARYAAALTPELAAAIDPADPHDPIRRQFVPDEAELHASPEELADPIGDGAHMPVNGIVHRYPDRVLLKPLHVCPVYCRFCFRREMVGPGGEMLTEAELAAALDYVRGRPEIFEVILTGGDPLMLSPRRLAKIVAALDAIPHVGVVRLHTRVPIADPTRITAKLVSALAAENTAIYAAIHCNHVRELTPSAESSIRRLAAAGVPLLGQTVLLKGVNDDASTLAALFRALVRLKVKPYYLHHADLARGTAHFRTTIAEGQALMRALRGRLSGLCQPSYVLDLPGGFGKVPIGPCYLREGADGGWIVEDFEGRRHAYPPAS
jgi:lysine 2,3-aminomutase